jgi:hypothetical protein
MAEKRLAKRVTNRANPPAKKAGGRAALLAKIAAMPGPWRAMGERVHAIIVRGAPALQPTVWYGMPGYARGGQTVCFFRADEKYMTFGFTQQANLRPEEGAANRLIGCASYFTALDDATEDRLAAIVGKVASCG